jgi:glyoxylase-like metal-dependent hydrolase (beta-lactamase superfamily II)
MKNGIARLEVGMLGTNCWIYVFDNDVFVVDPGGDTETIIAFLKSKRLAITQILLTHGHFDHIMALPGIHRAFPSAAISIHRADQGFVDGDALKRHCSDFKMAAGDDAFILSNWQEMPSVTRLLEGGDTVGPFTVLHTPGHTPGSVSYYHRDMRTLFSGDTLFRGGIGRTDLSGGDRTAMAESLRRLFALDGDTQVFPGHGEPTTIETERTGRYY